MAEKRTKKSARKKAPGKPFKKGHDPRRGNGPEKGAPNAGRPPDEFKARMAELASRDEVLDYIAECLTGEHGAKAAISAHKHVSDRGYGKVPSVTKIQGDGDEPLTIRVVTE